MKTIIEGVLSAQVPWGLCLLGAGLTSIALVFRLPSLAVAVGVYLPLSSMTPILIGGLVAMAVNKARKKSGKKTEDSTNEADPGVLAASGLVAGVGLIGVGISAYGFFAGKKPKGLLEQPLPTVIGLALFLGLAYYLGRMGKSGSASK